jgi:hypothetical protein
MTMVSPTIPNKHDMSHGGSSIIDLNIYIYTKIKFISFKPYIVYANKMNKLEFFLYKVNRLNMFETF